MRHGRSQSNVGHWHCSWPEKKVSHLIPEGIKQVEQASEFFKKHKPDLIFASDLTRTRKTAEIISKATSAPVIFDPLLRELDFGIFNFRPLTEYFKYFKNKSLIRFYQAPPKGKTLLQEQKRMVVFFKEIDKKYKNKKILIVSHMGTLWLLEMWLKGYAPEKAIRAGRAMLKYGRYKKLKSQY